MEKVYIMLPGIVSFAQILNSYDLAEEELNKIIKEKEAIVYDKTLITQAIYDVEFKDRRNREIQ